ncbi:YdbH domain-containing protein [Pseudoalteromonas sp. SMS1]|uniref:intermembrane phospholipid transport protein YdbH family protein n=1 Tax=Pseudoalteromonas sp. SMS1 TaxID=2908894 RepID=UPI001F1E5B3F|nr:YdbH domain-containing protein [Pseudoalteromonas sp. SMS1]MCF2859016.1 YdbH domain-containing protein [Pseudoalteromonas sp. SMS1]
MRRNVLVTVMVLLLTLIILYFCRVPLSLVVAKYVLPQGKITCLDWTFSGLTEVEVSEVCFENDDFKAKGKNITVTSERIDISSLAVAHVKTQKNIDNSEVQKLNIPMNAHRPLVSINQLSISSHLLKKPLNASVTEMKLNQFAFTGDVIAKLELSVDNLNVDFDLTSNFLAPYLPEPIKAFSGMLHFSTDGLSITYDADLNFRAKYQQEAQCEIALLGRGQVTGNWDFNHAKGAVNATSLPLDINLSHCEDLLDLQQELAVLRLSETWSVLSTENIQINKSDIILPSLRVSDSHGQTDIQIDTLLVNLDSQQVQGKLVLNHYGLGLGLVGLQAALRYGAQGLELSGDWVASNQQLNLPNGMEFRDIVSQGAFTLKGDPLQSLALESSAQLTAGKAVIHNTQLENTELNVNVASTINPAERTAKALWPIVIDKFDMQLTAERYQLQALSGKYVLFQGNAKLDEFGALIANTELDLGSFKIHEVRGKDIHQTARMVGEVTRQGLTGEINGEMHLGLVATPQLSFRDTTLTTSGTVKDSIKLEHIAYSDEFELTIEHILDGEINQIRVDVPKQRFVTLQPMMYQLVPQLQLSEGLISATAIGDLTAQIYRFDLELEEAGVLYDSHYIRGINLPLTGAYERAQLVVTDTTLNVAEVRSGAVLTDLSARLSTQQGTLALKDIHAKIFDGDVTAEQVTLSQSDQRFLIEAHNWDLALISDAGKSAGVELRGRVSGQLPVLIEQGEIAITHGKLRNIDVGFLSIENNESVEALKSHQAGIDTAFSLLESLDIEKLSSDVTLSPDGWLDLAVEIAGVNAQAQQPINFNYTHSENIFQLFRALRLSDEITNEVEKALNK